MFSEKTFKTAFFAWSIICLALLAGLVFVAIHFISKYW